MYILDAVFHRLANDQYCTRNRCIVITVSKYIVHLLFLKSFLSISSLFSSRGEGIQISPQEGRKLPLHIWKKIGIMFVLKFGQLSCFGFSIICLYLYKYEHILCFKVFATPHWEVTSAHLLPGRLWSIRLWHPYHIPVWFNGRIFVSKICNFFAC